MILVLTNGEHRVWVDVALKNGCEVRVGSLTVGCSNVEPVPWYKVCLLDYLTVNVRNSSLTWVIDSPLRSRTPSVPSLHNGSMNSHSHDSGYGVDIATGTSDGIAAMETIAESSAPPSPPTSPWNSLHRRRGNMSDINIQMSNTLPRVGASGYTGGGRTTTTTATTAMQAFATLEEEEDRERAARDGAVASAKGQSGRRRTYSDNHLMRDCKQQSDLTSRFCVDKPTSSLLQTSSPSSPVQGSHTSISSAASTPGISIPKQDGDDMDMMDGFLAHERTLNLSDLLASLENNLNYDSSVVYEIFSLCEKLLLEVVGKASSDHTRWIEERYAYGRLINEVQHIESLIQILHSHLLPFISVAMGDRSMVQWAVQQQQDAIAVLSEDILAQSMQESSLASSVDSLLSRVLPGVEASLRDGIFSRLFLTQLVADIDGRGLLRKAGEVLDAMQTDINRLKKILESRAATDADVDTLQRLRERRDDAHESLTELLKTREVMTLHLQNTREDRGSLLPAQKSYLQACKVHGTHHLRTAALMEKKVAALGMREALQEALQRLDEQTPDDGDDTLTNLMVSNMPRTAMLTASLGHVRHELLPLRDAIETLISDVGNSIGFEHLKFCEDIVIICNDTTVPSILAFGVPRVGAVVMANSSTDCGCGSARTTAGMNRALSVYEVIDPAREYVDDTAVKIMEHMDSVVSQLMKHFPKKHVDQIYRKLYLTYERFLFQKIGHTIDDLYTVWAQKIVNQLLRVTEYVENVSFEQLQARLNFPDGWWSNLFLEPATPRPEDRRTAVFSPNAPAAPFQRLLAPAAAALHRLIGTVWPLNKAELLTKSIQHITRSLGEYHGKELSGRSSATQVGSDDLVPVVILFILYCKPEIIATLCMNCLLLEDMCPEFLRNGMHGFSMVQYQGALHVIASLLPTEQLSPANAEGRRQEQFLPTTSDV